MEANELETLFQELNDADGQRRLEAARRLTEMGEAGASVLARAMQAFPWWRGMKARLLERQYDERLRMFGAVPLPPVVAEPPFHAVQALSCIGGPALAAIARLLRDERIEVRLAAMLSLDHMPSEEKKNTAAAKEVLEGLCFSIADIDPQMRIQACQRLYAFREHVAPAIPLMIEKYRRATQPDERMAIIRALISVQCSAEVLADVVVDFIKNSDRKTQREIFTAFYFRRDRTTLAPLVPLMLEFIRTCQGNEIGYDEESVASALGRVGAIGRDAILELARHHDPRFRDAAFKAIKEFPKDEDCRMFAAFLLDRLEPRYAAGESGSEAENLLINIRNGHGLYPDDEACWNEMQRALQEKLSSSAFVDELIRDLHSGDKDVVFHAADKVEKIQGHYDQIAPHLLFAITHADELAAYACSRVLAKLAPQCAVIAPDLMEMIERNEAKEFRPSYCRSTMTLWPAELLQAMKGKVAYLTPRLARQLKHESAIVRRSSLAVLQSIGPAALEYVPSLIEEIIPLLHDVESHESASVRRASLVVLESIGPAALEYAPGLIEEIIPLLHDPESNVCHAALSALRAMGAAARRAAPQIMLVAQSHEMELVKAARELLAHYAYADLKAGS